ncbi:single-stranded DNA-binding protein [Methylosinus sp. PW1]|uniref:single-stranded DNA-binding protein n=1 Tax=Methylosinus sp. PW1 TaxID=107636 RepID=UPI00055F86E7|nr:single-stranded DNA-binding protein [Methylosinus sp. PW1]
MTIYALVTGTMFRAPEEKASKGGKPFVVATIRVDSGNREDAAEWWRAVAFSETARVELLRLHDGDAVSVQGALQLELYESDGERRLSRKIIAYHVTALRQPKAATGQQKGARPPSRTPAQRAGLREEMG